MALKYFIKCDKIVFYSNYDIPSTFLIDKNIGLIFLKQNKIEEGIFSLAVSIGMLNDMRMKKSKAAKK